MQSHSRSSQSFRYPIGILSGALLLFTLTTGCAFENPILHEEWQTVSIAGSPVGYMHTVTRYRGWPGTGAIVTTIFAKNRYDRLGYTIEVHSSAEHIEAMDGSLIQVTSSRQMGTLKTTCRATVQDNRMTIETVIGGKKHSREIPYDCGVIGPYAQIRRTRKTALKANGFLEFKSFMPDFRQIAVTRLRVDRKEQVELNGGKAILWHGTITQGVVPGVATEVWMDDDGNVARSLTDLLGGLETRRSSSIEAMRTVAPSRTVDLIDEFMVACNKEIPVPHSVKEVLYRIEAPPHILAQLQLEDRRQTIEERKRGRLLLRVRAIGDAEKPAGRRPGAIYLRPSPYVQSSDPAIMELAGKGIGDAETQLDKARNLQKWVYKYIRNKDFALGFASAKEVARTRQGDCTEHAVLLTALLRAQGIPARVAIGLVYYQKRFAYHMWTEAFLNDWTAFDPSLSEEIVDATHIKLSHSALETDSSAAPFRNTVKVIGHLKLNIEELK